MATDVTETIGTNATINTLPKEQDGASVELHQGNELSNYGGNITIKPKYVFVPKTIEGLCATVKWCRAEKLRIRTAGYRHSWANVYPDEGQVLISLLGLSHVLSDRSSTEN